MTEIENVLGQGSTENKLERLAVRSAMVDQINVQVDQIVHHQSSMALPFYLHVTNPEASTQQALICVPVSILQGFNVEYLVPNPDRTYQINGITCSAISLHRMSSTMVKLMDGPAEDKFRSITVNSMFEINMIAGLPFSYGPSYPTEKVDFSGQIFSMKDAGLPYTTMLSMPKDLYQLNGSFVLNSFFVYTGSGKYSESWGKESMFEFYAGSEGGPSNLSGASGYVRFCGSTEGNYLSMIMSAF